MTAADTAAEGRGRRGADGRGSRDVDGGGFCNFFTHAIVYTDDGHTDDHLAYYVIFCLQSDTTVLTGH